jgi:DNA repair protein RecO (recombination protein O)
MPLEKDRAVVIRTHRLGEADRIITFCAARSGKVRAVGKGSRRAKSRLGASLELFNIGDLVFYAKPNRDLHIITAFDVSEAVGSRLRDPFRVAYASYCAELAGEFSLEGEENAVLFGLLRDALLAVERAASLGELGRAARALEMKLLTSEGYRPHLENCVVCGGLLSDRDVAMDVGAGGALCDRHRSQGRPVIVARGTLLAARQLAVLPFDGVGSVALTRRQAAELKRLLSLFLALRLEKPLRSAAYIEALEKETTGEPAALQPFVRKPHDLSGDY